MPCAFVDFHPFNLKIEAADSFKSFIHIYQTMAVITTQNIVILTFATMRILAPYCNNVSSEVVNFTTKYYSCYYRQVPINHILPYALRNAAATITPFRIVVTM
jgi:hypothetical protein